MRPARAQKRDANEFEIVQALRKAGFEVLICVGLPFDILVGRHAWCTMEIKTGRGRLTDSQVAFFSDSRTDPTAPRVVVRTVEESLAAAYFHCARRFDGQISQ